MRLSLFLFFSFTLLSSNAQTFAVGQTATESALRNLQLTGKLDANFSSFTIRPLVSNDSVNLKTILHLADTTYQLKRKKINFQLLPIALNTKFNSERPFGWNDAGMRMVRGFQQSFSAGFYLKAGPLTVQLQPEYYQINPQNYDTTVGFGSNNNKPLSERYWGQSSIRLNTKSLSLGVSTENLWWGPGQFSSLFMSNNAPGFKHITFNTRKPIKTWLGSFEWQMVVGQLNEDTSFAFENNFLKTRVVRNENRYFNAFIITYQPKWMKNFFLGLTRYEILYNSEQEKRSGNFLKRYLPVFTFETANENASGKTKNDGGAGIFLRYLMPKQHSEFYFEFGYNDFKQNIRDLTLNSSHASAYLVGFKKIFPLVNKSFLDFSIEIANTAQNPNYIIRNAENWYIHGDIKQGYTNQNQTMGAGSGIGNNVQTVALQKSNSKWNQFGIKIQRIQQNPKGVNRASLSSLGMRNIIWNDYDFGITFQKRLSFLILNGEAHVIHSTNYGWENGNRNNAFLQLNLIYILP